MAYNKMNWEAGEVTREGYVIVDGQQYQTVQPEYTGNTPINPDNLNHMDNGIYNNSTEIENLKPVKLFSGESTTTLTLSKNINNFKRIKIFGVNADNISVFSEVYNDKTSSITTTILSCAVGGSDAYIYSGSLSIDGTAGTLSRLALTRIRNNNTSVVTNNSNAIKIKRIEGYLQ